MLQGEVLKVRPPPSFWNAGGLLGLRTWQGDGDSIPLLRHLPEFRQVVLARQAEIKSLAASGDQASNASYLGLIAKELYWEFKSELEQALDTRCV